MVKHNLEKYVLYAVVDACCDRCADVTLEEESPQLNTITLKDFIKQYGDKR